MTNLSSESPTQLSTEPVSFRTTYYASGLVVSEPITTMLDWSFANEAFHALMGGWHMTFAHVLSVPESEDIWPGEAISLFPLSPALFAVSPDTGKWINDGLISEHMRCETLRLCKPNVSALDALGEQLVFDCEFGGAFPSSFGDRCEDEDGWSKPEWLEEDFEPFYYPGHSSTLPGEAILPLEANPTEKED